MVDFASVHMDPEHWDDPQRFNPDRFLPEVAKQRDAYAYLPFGGGARACIGNHFALLEATAALGRILRGRRLSHASDERAPVSIGITMTPSRAVEVDLTPV